MNKFKVVALAGLLTFSVAQLGFAGYDDNRAERHARHGHHQKGKNPMRMFSKLNLSDSQERDLRNLFESQKPSMQARFEQKKSLMRQLHETSRQTTLDTQRVDSLASQLGKLEADMAAERAKIGNKAYNMLTTEQQAKFNEIVKKKQERRMQRRNNG